jgi:hypothetical protein
MTLDKDKILEYCNGPVATPRAALWTGLDRADGLHLGK